MANLQKVIKVTQSQYNVLASGGRVGDYVGLDDRYIYMIEDENEYLPTTGGTITGNLTVDGTTTFKQNSTYASDKGIEFIHNNADNYYTAVAINANVNNNEIIYNNSSLYKPLFANDNGLVIYSEDENYNDSIIFNTKSLVIADYNGSQNYININNYNGEIYYYNENDGSEYTYTLPTNSGTLALTSDIPSVSLNTTTGSESITVGSDSLNVMTTDTAQTVPGQKTLDNLHISFKENNKTNSIKFNGPYTTGEIYQDLYDIYFTTPIKTGGKIYPDTNNSYDLGTSDKKWKDLYLSGTINAGQVIKSTYSGATYALMKRGDDAYVICNQATNKGIRIDGRNNALLPNVSSNSSLGSTTDIWTNLYLSGNLSDGTNSITVANIQEKVQVKRYI